MVYMYNMTPGLLCKYFCVNKEMKLNCTPAGLSCGLHTRSITVCAATSRLKSTVGTLWTQINKLILFWNQTLRQNYYFWNQTNSDTVKEPKRTWIRMDMAQSNTSILVALIQVTQSTIEFLIGLEVTSR